MGEKIRLENVKKKEKWNFLGTNEILGDYRIEFSANKVFFLDGCQTVEEYSEDYVKIKLNKGFLFLCGRDLNITNFENQNITIKGEFSTLEFSV